MLPQPSQSGEPFGGAWSDVKLRALREYLVSYRQVLKNQPFKLGYIDAFAGAGSQAVTGTPEDAQSPLFAGLDTTSEETAYRHGSPLIAMAIEPPFDSFIFIEKDPNSLAALRAQIDQQGHGSKDVRYKCGDANTELLKLCRANWTRHRAVAFLDPFAMQLRWDTIEAIADTRAIDLWLLFPAMAVNRMLPRSGVIPNEWQQKLTGFFGADSWREAFYVPRDEDLFGESGIQKVARTFERISAYVTERLAIHFAGVVESPLILRNSSNSPIFLLCFACGNERGAGPAIRIANHIIRTKSI